MRKTVVIILLALTGCQGNEPSLLDHPIVQAVIAKLTGKELDPADLEEAAAQLTDEQRQEYKEKYKDVLKKYRDKKNRDTASSDSDEP
jgi:hypothetical protein